MDLTWSATDSAFRHEVRAFLQENLTPELQQAGRLMTSVYADHEASMQWQRILHERGWAAPAWPVEHGGCDWTLTQHYIFSRERAELHLLQHNCSFQGEHSPRWGRFRGCRVPPRTGCHLGA